jgi:hypothetical protein
LRDPASKTFYDRKRAEGKRHNAALICLARRRCDVILAILGASQPGPLLSSPMPPHPPPPQALVPALRCGQAARLEREAPAEIGPAHELAGRVLTAITARSGCDHAVFG